MREVLALAPTRRFSERMILDALGGMMPEPVTYEELRKSIEWNHSRNFIEYRFNGDMERNEWFLTDAGKQKEGL